MRPMPGQSTPSTRTRLAEAARRLGPAAVRYWAGAVLLLLLVVLGFRLAMGPVHGVRDAAGCERAYAAARTRADSLSVAFLSYPDPAGRQQSRRCGDLRLVQGHALGR